MSREEPDERPRRGETPDDVARPQETMRKRDRREFGRYCRAVADRLELRDWTVNLLYADPEPPDRQDGAKWGASSESTPGRKSVCLTFPPSCRDWSREEIRQTVAHELVHAHLAVLVEIFREDLHGQLGQQAYDLLNASATRHLEFAVDALADAVAKHLPLIEWPKGSR